MNKVIIALGHKARQGKTEVADAVGTYCFNKSISYERASISEMIRLHLVSLRRLPKDLPRSSFKPAQVQLLVDHAQEMRERDEFFWVNILARKVELSDSEVVVFENLRTKNEVELVRSRKGRRGYAVEVARYGPENVRYIAEDRNPSHFLETALDGYLGWDFRLRNDRDLFWLQSQAWAIMDYVAVMES